MGVELPFRMLAEQDGHRLPEIVIREQDNPTLARLLRLSIDRTQLEDADFKGIGSGSALPIPPCGRSPSSIPTARNPIRHSRFRRPRPRAW